jgi:hypothetical protein
MDTHAIATLLDRGDYVVLGRSASCYIAVFLLFDPLCIALHLPSIGSGENGELFASVIQSMHFVAHDRLQLHIRNRDRREELKLKREGAITSFRLAPAVPGQDPQCILVER